MSKTNHFNLDYIDPYQQTSQDIFLDERRFKTIDNNLYALFSVFGNGVIVLESTEFPLYVELATGANATKSITVTSGRAFVNYKSINYDSSTELSLPTQTGSTSSQKYYLYLKDNSQTPELETGEFFFSSTKLEESTAFIGLGAIQVDYSLGTAEYFDDSSNGRQILNVKKLFINFINSHAHTGGLGNPKKVDLENETVGSIGPDNISIVDSSKIRGSELSEYVTPKMDHNKVKNSGNLSHSQLDSAILSMRDNLNLEIVTSINNLKTISNIIRTTTESSSVSGSISFPSGSIATIDRNLSNIFIYVPDITSDSFLVGYNGYTGSMFPNLGTMATGPVYLTTPIEKIAEIDRVNNVVRITTSGSATPSSNTQKILTLQNIDPQLKMNTYGQSGYFAGFVAGLSSTSNSGSAHLIHILKGSTGSLVDTNEYFDTYSLTLKDKYNTAGIYGGSPIQIACLLTNLIDFSPADVINGDIYTHILYSAANTGPRILSQYLNGYIPSLTPTSFFTNTGPVGNTNSFYYESTTGPKALLFSNGNIIADLGAGNYVLPTIGNGQISLVNEKIVLGEFSSTNINLIELGPTGSNLTISAIRSATSVSNIAVVSLVDENNYRFFYIDNNRLYIADSGTTTQLGFFSGVVDMVVKFNKIFILTNENGNQKLYYAFESGLPTVFSQISLLVTSPSSAKIDVFRQSDLSPIFISIVSSSDYQVFDTTGKEIYKYSNGITGGSGPLVSSIYTQFDLGDATVDLKYV